MSSSPVHAKRLSELFAPLQLAVHNAAQLTSPGQQGDPLIEHIAFDARACRKNSLFVAWQGKAHDGHAHVHNAAERGAVAVVCAREIATELPYVVVDEPRRWLGPLGQALFDEPARALTLVGITGTAGKTTCAHLSAAMLAAHFGEAGLLGTLGAARIAAHERAPHGEGFATGAPLTTPEGSELAATLAAWRDDGVQAAALEASSIALVQGRLLGTRCDVALMTSFSREHLDFHGDMQRYLAAKALLFEAHVKEGGTCVFNADDEAQDALADACEARGQRVLRYSVHPPTQQRAGRAAADVYVAHAKLHATGIDALAHVGGELWPVSSRLIGPFNLANLVAVLAVGVALKLPLATLVRGLAALAQVGGRLERVAGSGRDAPLVLVDYAHKPAALAAALAAARALTQQRLVCVFGCGGERDVGKRYEMGEIAARLADVTVVTDDNPRREDSRAIADEIERGLVAGGAQLGTGREASRGKGPAYLVELDRRRAIAEALALAGGGDVVLIAGKGHETYQERNGRKEPFDDRSVAAELLGNVQSGA